MTLSDRAIETPRLVILVALLLAVLGGAALLRLPKERTPRAKLPVIVVAVPNPGAPPTTNEAQIINRIEDAIGEKGLDNLRSEGGYLSQAVANAAVVQFVFDDGVKVRDAKQDVQELVNSVEKDFPLSAEKPIIRDVAFDDFPIIQIFISRGEDGEHRRRVAEKLADDLKTVAGVADVELFGGLEREVRVEVDPHLMALHGFTYEDVHTAIRGAILDAPSGTIESAGGSDQRVRTDAKPRSVEEIEALPIGVREGKLIHLLDLADVSMGHKSQESLARYGGEDAVVLLVRAKTDIDVMAAATQVQERVDRFVIRGEGEDTHIGTVRSQAREIRYMMNQLGSSAAYGTVLVAGILLVALGWRNAALIGVSMPFALLCAFAFMWLSKITIAPNLAINNMTLFGLILVVGMVVDGCIIVGENIFRHRELGRSPLDAAQRGVREVGASLAAAYLTTFAAFAPMFMVRGVMGDFLELLPIVVLFALCAAMLVDHFLLPVLSLYFMKSPAPTTGGTGGLSASGSSVLDEDSTGGQAASGTRAPAEEMTLEQMEIENAEAVAQRGRVNQVYGRMLRYALHHRLLVLAMATIMTLAPVGLFMSGAIGFEFFPDTDVPIIEIYFELPLGSSMKLRTAEAGAKIEQAVLRAVWPEEWHQPSRGGPRVRPVTTMGNPGALNTRLDADQGSGPEFGMVYVELELAEHRKRSAAQIRQAIMEAIPPLPGVIVRVKSPQEGPPVGAPVMVRVLGRKDTPVERLVERGEQIRQLIASVPGTYDVASDYRLRPEVAVRPNYAEARLYDMDALRIASAVNYALEGVIVGEVDFGGKDRIDVRLRNMATNRDQFEDLANLPLITTSGGIVTLDEVADVTRDEGANILRHYDGRRVVNIRAELEPGVLPDDVKASLVRALYPELSSAQRRRLVRQEDVLQADGETMVKFGGENEMRDDAMADLSLAMGVAFAAMLVILVMKFNSFVQPLIVLASVPLSLVGVALGLMLCGFYFSISAMIGVVALAGIVVNDAIVLVDFINQLKKAGIPMEKAVVYAGQIRLRPIMLTSVTTIGGLLPLALNLAGGGEFWQPLTITIMFGLAFATLLQLFLVPLACYTLDFRSTLFDPKAEAAEEGLGASGANKVQVAG